MKDRKMTVQLAEGVVFEVWHKTEMGNLTSLWTQVAKRSKRARTPDMAKWLDSVRTQTLIEGYRELNPGSPIVEVRGKGRNAATWAHIDLTVSAMAYLDPMVETKVVHEFIHNRVLAWRDESGEEFKTLNALMAMKARNVLGRPAHRGHYIALANAIRARCNVADWDTSTAAQLRERTRIEDALSSMLKMDLVRDWDHLKELAEAV